MFGASRSPELAGYFGLFERAFYITTIIWIGTVSVSLLHPPVTSVSVRPVPLRE